MLQVLTHPRVGIHRVLVCCPLSTVLNWVDEIHKWITPVTNEIKVIQIQNYVWFATLICIFQELKCRNLKASLKFKAKCQILKILKTIVCISISEVEYVFWKCSDILLGFRHLTLNFRLTFSVMVRGQMCSYIYFKLCYTTNIGLG